MTDEFKPDPSSPEASSASLPTPAKPNWRPVLYLAVPVLALALASIIILEILLYGGDYGFDVIDYHRTFFLQEKMSPVIGTLFLLGASAWALVVFQLFLSSGRSIAIVRRDRPASPKLWGLKRVLTAVLVTALSLVAIITAGLIVLAVIID